MPGKRRGEPLVRDLHASTEEIETKIAQAKATLENLAQLKEKVDAVSELIREADKDKEERVGKVERDIADHELKAIENALLKHNKVPVDAFEVQQLRGLEKAQQQEKAAKKQKLSTMVQQRVSDQLRFKELEFAEKYADVRAKEQAFSSERKTLTQTIEALRLEIESQKKLTGDIAKAAAQPPPIQQIVRSS
ncbi:hypothetical protein DIPPA_03408 [Diplonema papillatum]|nr:hypothetical protein DIPPA_03408 [Diplonema papillatum]